MKRLMMAVLVALPLAASANSAFKDCSMKAAKTAKKADLERMATSKPAEAKSIALKDHAGGSIVKGGIETEDGCLVYSYHVKDASGKGQTEVFVDAGNGMVLKNEHGRWCCSGWNRRISSRRRWSSPGWIGWPLGAT